MEHLQVVIERLEEAQLKLKPVKCQFIRKEVDYLGHVLTPEGLKVNTRLVDAVTNFHHPRVYQKCTISLGLRRTTSDLAPNSPRLPNHRVP